MKRSIFILCLLGLVGCEEPPSNTPAPLRPLTYTEFPDITPAGAAVRERRLLRQLNAGAASGWGRLESTGRTIAPATTPKQLAEGITAALLNRDADRWAAAFVGSSDYAALVHVDLEKAATFVDQVQGESAPTWEALNPPLASEMVDGGFPNVFAFARIELGSPRDLAGKPAVDDPEQYWNSRVVWVYKPDPSVEVGLLLPKIIRAGVNSPYWGLAASVKMKSELSNLLEAGLHLKPELLRNDEYPFPLKVGNFWRYRRSYPDSESEFPEATEALEEVVSVDLYGALRVVKLRRALNDASLSKRETTLILLPRRVYRCDRACRKAVPDLKALIPYFAHQKSLLRFPIREQDIRSSIPSLETPAGHFVNLVEVALPSTETRACPIEEQPNRRCPLDAELTTFAVGRGMVTRRLVEPSSGRLILEELTEYRLVP